MWQLLFTCTNFFPGLAPPPGGYPSAVPPPPGSFNDGYPPPHPPRGPPGYQGYFDDDYPPPPPQHIHHQSWSSYRDDVLCSSFLRTWYVSQMLIQLFLSWFVDVLNEFFPSLFCIDIYLIICEAESDVWSFFCQSMWYLKNPFVD